LNQPNTGILFVVPVLSAWGLAATGGRAAS